jgi:adenylate kinase
MTARGEKVRSDDNPEVLKGRLAAYRTQTAPLTHYYGSKGILRVVDGMAPIDGVTAAIDRLLAKPAPRKAKPGRANVRAKAKPGKAKQRPKSSARRPGSRSRKAAKNKGGLRKSGSRRRLTKAR